MNQRGEGARVSGGRRGWERSWLMAAGWLVAATPGWAADATAPTTPVVTDDGTATSVTTSLHATWTSSDPESGIAEYQYLIRQDSTSGVIIANFTSTGTTASVTHTGLSLLQGKKYYLGIQAKNGVGLWSAVGYSNGITVDTTAPSAPTGVIEGSSTADLDYDADGSYPVYWSAASDAESGISTYELQERVEPNGVWTTLTSTTTSKGFSVSGRVDKTRYVYQARAKNGAGIWGPWSAVSDGMLVDKTAPGAVTVTDDGALTSSTTALHATWTASSDVESGVVEYQYVIQQDSTSGTVIVNWTSVGLATEVTRTGLGLANGKLYYIGVRAKNGANLYSLARYSDGIRAPDPTEPSAPGQPTEGSSTDLDYDGDGAYAVYWTAAVDADSGIAAYELQEQVGVGGAWVTLTSTSTALSFSVSGRLDKTSYRYQARAKNGVGTWGPWSVASDGMLIDKTAPSTIAAVTDDGATTFSTTTLHATWTPSADVESGIAAYEYLIRQDSTAGAILLNWTPVGIATQVTRTGLSLINGKKYFIAVRAKNGAGLYCALRYSDGITIVVDTTPPVITITAPVDGAIVGR